MIRNSYDMRQYERGQERMNLRECKRSLDMAFQASKATVEAEAKDKGIES